MGAGSASGAARTARSTRSTAPNRFTAVGLAARRRAPDPRSAARRRHGCPGSVPSGDAIPPARAQRGLALYALPTDRPRIGRVRGPLRLTLLTVLVSIGLLMPASAALADGGPIMP